MLITKIEGVFFGTTDEFGALLVWCKPEWRGNQVRLGPDTREHYASVVEKTYEGKQIYIAVFPRLTEETYVVSIPGVKAAEVYSVFPGHVAEVDWR